MIDAAEPPKRKAFKRQRALEGVLRTYKVRMLVTEAQRQELKLAFSMARRSYNWAIGCINAGANTNFGELRKIFFSEPVPEWAQDKKGGHAVHTKFMARAIKQAWDAFQTNWAKWRKNPKHHFKVGFRSLKASYTTALPRLRGRCRKRCPRHRFRSETKRRWVTSHYGDSGHWTLCVCKCPDPCQIGMQCINGGEKGELSD